MRLQTNSKQCFTKQTSDQPSFTNCKLPNPDQAKLNQARSGWLYNRSQRINKRIKK